jgi:hypothetical protein
VREFEVRSGAPVAAGVDGEATVLQAPLRFRSLPAALRVRIAPSHSGASPSAAQPSSVLEGLRALVAIALGRNPRHDATLNDGRSQPPA